MYLGCTVTCTVGCVILFENPNFNFGIWNQVVLMYNKEAPKVESVNFLFLAALFSPKISTTPFITQKNFRSVYRVYGIQNDRLQLTVSTQKSVWKNMHWVLRNRPKCPKIWRFGLVSWILTLFCSYLGTRWIFFKTDFCTETVSSSPSFWAPWTL